MEEIESNEPKSEGADQPKPPKSPVPPVSGPLASFEAWLYKMLVVDIPFQLPVVAKEFIVKYGPWISLAIGILMLPLILTAIAVMGIAGTYVAAYGTGQVGLFYWLAVLALVIQVIVMFISIPMLLKRERRGWLLIFYANIFSLVYSVLNSFSYGYLNLGGLLSGLVGAAIGLYFLFQIRSYYTK